MPAPSIQTLSFLFLLALAFVLGFAYPSTQDPDIWWHLKTGEWIIANGTVPWTDPFAAHTVGMRWVAYSWLAEVFFYVVDRWDSFQGLRFIQGAVAAATVAVLYFHARAASQNPRLSLMLCALFLVPIVPWLARPQMFSFLFTALTMFLLWWGENRDQRAWWALPVVLLFWANLHIYFVFGLGLIWLFLFWPWLAWFVGGRKDSHPSYLGILIVLITTAAPLINPYGLTLYDEAFHLALHGTSDWPASAIRELASPNFHEWPRKVFILWIGLGLFAFVVPDNKPPVLIVLLFLAILYRALQHVRDVPYLLVVMLPILAVRLSDIKNLRWRQFISGNSPPMQLKFWPQSILHWVLALCAIAVFSAMPLRFSIQKKELSKHRVDRYPAAAAAYIRAANLEGPIYNSLNWGGYLIYAITPDYRVYIDGRTQLYSAAFWDAHNTVRQGKPGWEEGLDSSGARIVIWDREEPLAALLRQNSKWLLVYEDGEADVFVKRTAK